MNLYDGSQNDYDLKENQISMSSINFKSKSTNSGTNLNNSKLLQTPVTITNKSFISSSTTATNKQNNNLILNKSHQKSSSNIESTLNNNNKSLTSSSTSKPQIRGYSVDRQIITTGSEKKKK